MNPNWLKPEAQTTISDAREPLPVGAYVAEILGAKNEGNRIVMQLDVCEGDNKGFYKAEYESLKGVRENPRFGGTYSLWIPTGDGSEKDGFTIQKFNRFAGNVEYANPGFKFDYDHLNTLKGKKIGIQVREYYWAWDKEDGSHTQGVRTEIGGLCSVDYARSGKAKDMKPRYASNYRMDGSPAPANIATSSVVPGGTYTVVDDEELPF